jgi:hypothetical protein
MILSAQSIRRRCLERDPPLITPFTEEGTSPGGNSFGLGPASYDVRIDQEVIIPPYGFLRASTVERFHMPTDLIGTVRDKSTWARLFLAVQNTLLDPGWPGYPRSSSPTTPISRSGLRRASRLRRSCSRYSTSQPRSPIGASITTRSADRSLHATGAPEGTRSRCGFRRVSRSRAGPRQRTRSLGAHFRSRRTWARSLTSDRRRDRAVISGARVAR